MEFVAGIVVGIWIGLMIASFCEEATRKRFSLFSYVYLGLLFCGTITKWKKPYSLPASLSGSGLAAY